MVKYFDLSVTGDVVGIGGERGTVQLWDIETGQMRWEHKSAGTINALRLDHAGMVAAAINTVGTSNSEITRWNFMTGQEVSRFATNLESWNFAPHGTSALIFPPRDARPVAVDLLSGNRMCLRDGAASAHPICFTPSGNHYVSAPDNIYLVDSRTLEGTVIVDNHKGNHWTVLSATENAQVVLVKRYGGFAAFRRDGQRWTFFYTPGENVDAAAISPDESRCATLSSEGTVTLWELKSGRELLRFNLPRPSQSGQIRFCNDGQRLMCVFTTGVARGIGVATWDTNGR
jgi:WD40 repeat protein